MSWKEKKEEWLKPSSDNFMGTGMNLQEILSCGTADKFENSWFRRDREERRRCLEYLIELSVLLRRYEDTGERYGIERMRQALESIIEGDWSGVRVDLSHRDAPQGPALAISRRFYGVLAKCYEGRPESEGVAEGPCPNNH